MELKLGYKRTEVGVIPEDWVIRTLDSLGRRGKPAIKAGPFGSSLTKNTYVADGYKVYGQEQVICGDYLFGDYFITKSRFNELKSCAVEPGDILLSLVGTVGRVLVIPQGAPEGVINPRLIRFSFDQNLISPFFFQAVFEADIYQKLLSRIAQGGTMGVLNAGLLRSICIPIPPYIEQEAIAEALSDTDALIESLVQLITKKRLIKQGAMQGLITGKKRLPGFSDRWEIIQLGDVAAFHKGKGLPKSALDINGIFPCIHYGELFTRYPETIQEVISHTNKFENDFRSIANDVLMPTSDVTPNGLAKASCIKYSDVILGGDILVIRSNVDRVCGSFLSYVIRHAQEQILQLVTGSTVFHIYASDMKKFTFPITSIAEQFAIVEILEGMDTELTALETKLTKTRALKQGMMHELLTGKTRLI